MKSPFAFILSLTTLTTSVMLLLIGAFLLIHGEANISIPDGSRYLLSAGFIALALYYLLYTLRLNDIVYKERFVRTMRMRVFGLLGLASLLFAGWTVLKYLAVVISGDESLAVQGDVYVLIGLLVIGLIFLSIASARDSRKDTNAVIELRSFMFPGIALLFSSCILMWNDEVGVFQRFGLLCLSSGGIGLFATGIGYGNKWLDRMRRLSDASSGECGWMFYVLGRTFIHASMLCYALAFFRPVGEAIFAAVICLGLGFLFVFFIGLSQAPTET